MTAFQGNPSGRADAAGAVPGEELLRLLFAHAAREDVGLSAGEVDYDEAIERVAEAGLH